MHLKKFSTLFLALLVLVLISARPVSSTGPILKKVMLNGVDPAMAAALEQTAIAEMELHHTPGLGVGVVMGNTLVYEGYFGLADREQNRPIDESSLFRIGSISKSMTTIGLLQQWEQGKFKLDDDVNQYLPKPMIHPPRPEHQTVTFRQLLTHTSGVGEFLSYGQALMPGQGAAVKGYDYKPLAHYLRFEARNGVPPGVKYAYSNYGFGFIGLALETMAGQPFDRYMTDHVFLPLGMKDTSYQHTADTLPLIVAGYSWTDKRGWKRRPHQAYGITPSGNVYATVKDFGLYVEALLNGGRNRNGSVIQPETLAMMMTPQHTFDPRQTAYGFGLVVYGQVYGYRIVGHSGSVPFGYHSHMLLAPDDRIGVFVFANGEDDTATITCWKMLKLLLNGQDDPLPNITPDTWVWADLEGYYGPRYPQFKTSARIYMSNIGRYHVKVDGDQLKLIYDWQGAKKAKTLVPASADDPNFFRIKEPTLTGVPAYVSFHQDPDGSWVMVPGGLDEYVQLGPVRVVKAKMVTPLGRALTKVNPF